MNKTNDLTIEDAARDLLYKIENLCNLIDIECADIPKIDYQSPTSPEENRFIRLLQLKNELLRSSAILNSIGFAYLELYQ